MNVREILNIVAEAQGNAAGRQQEILRVVGRDLKDLLQHINIGVIADATLADHVIRTVGAAYNRKGSPRPDFIAAMYGQDTREEELELDEMEAKVNKLRAEADRINRS